ncbi:S-adenosyl-L-methionine-dependent methyltransferase [Massariosphaeria phaeospora]|uniref:S-adenosyl-L-methionine-dependent methyltransferase n=1 Tax=Massariosphaeria phaeospora TaxID=100035 RepID=A0A7C8MEG2_9PLEO|nr:S-adenosyl-L-methionine-dependent methyltransferase [Massariosphaeria phaeospora]
MARGGRGGSRGGGRRPFRGKGKNRGGGGGGGGGRDTRTQSWVDVVKKNELFESYYRLGGFLPEEEFEIMWKTLTTDLPNSFRFTGTKADALAVREIFKKRYIPAITAVQFEGQPVQPPEPVQAFPDELVWHMKTHKKVIRRFAPFADFQRFLVAETTSGNISRQEVVSMIPPHFLDVKPGMVVLDMCAAPGSKSAQLAEMIHGDEEDRVKLAANNQSPNIDDGSDYSDDGRSTGLLIANDSDYKRAGLLVHQVKRLNFPNLIVTQHDASIFPSIELPTAEGARKNYLKFDRILADVPCSGDGTARKNVNVWQKWSPRDGLGLHSLQLRILLRGIQLLKKGGRLVYSTCSMNPVENEAVVASAIAASGGITKVRIVDCSDHLPGLIRKPGLNKWKVLDTSYVKGGEDKTAHLFTNYDAFLKAKEKYEDEEPERQFSSKFLPGMFPPVAASEDERMPLEHCMRVYPHLQDTGGFFIAILEKVDDRKGAQNKPSVEEAEEHKDPVESKATIPIPAEPSENETQTEASEQQNDGPTTQDASSLKRKVEDSDETAPLKKAKTEDADADADADADVETEIPVDGSAPNEDSTAAANGSATPAATSTDVKKLRPEHQSQGKEYFEYLSAKDPTIADILDFFGISARFPRDRFMVKNKEGLLLNKIYYTSALAKSIIDVNKDRGMKFIHCGVVMFVSHRIKDTQTLKAPWRLQNEGIKILEPWASDRIVTCTSKATLHSLLIEMFPKLTKDGQHGIGEVGDQLAHLGIGCCFLRIDKSDGEDGFPFPMVLPVWRHPGSINLMVDKDDRKAMLLRLFNEKDPYILNHVAEKAKAAAAEEARKLADEKWDKADGAMEQEEEMQESEIQESEMQIAEETGETLQEEDDADNGAPLEMDRE